MLTHLKQWFSNKTPPQKIPITQKSTYASLFSEWDMEHVFSLLSRMPDPDSTLQKAGITRDKLRALEGDDEISGALDTRREAVLSVPWRLDPIDRWEIKFIQQELRGCIESILRGAFTAIPYGYSVIEVVYEKREGGRIGIAKAQEKPFEWFYWTREGKIKVRDRYGTDQVCDSRKFFATVRSPSFRNPYGEALLSRLYWPWLFRSQGWKFWMTWLERWGTPFLIGKTSGSPAEMVNALSAAVQGATIAVNTNEEVSIVQQNSGGIHFEQFETAVTKRIQKLILGQTLTTDTQGGSYAAAKIHDQVRMDKRNADIKLVNQTVQRLVETLWTLNQFSGQAPRFVMEDDTGLETERADRDAKLLNTGMVKFTKNYFINNYDFENDEIEVVSSIDTSIQKKTAPLSLKAATEFSISALLTPEQQSIEKLNDQAFSTVFPMITDEQLKTIIDESKNPEELEEKLADTLKNTDVRQFNEILTRCLIAADIMGYVHEQSR